MLHYLKYIVIIMHVRVSFRVGGDICPLGKGNVFEMGQAV